MEIDCLTNWIGNKEQLEHSLHGQGNAHAAANAEGGNATTSASALQRIEQRDQDTCTRGPNGMTQSNGATIHVHLAGIQLQALQHSQRLSGKGLV